MHKVCSMFELEEGFELDISVTGYHRARPRVRADPHTTQVTSPYQFHCLFVPAISALLPTSIAEKFYSSALGRLARICSRRRAAGTARTSRRTSTGSAPRTSTLQRVRRQGRVQGPGEGTGHQEVSRRLHQRMVELGELELGRI